MITLLLSLLACGEEADRMSGPLRRTSKGRNVRTRDGRSISIREQKRRNNLA